MDTHGLYKPQYGNSYALVVGINKYIDSSPLAYAVNDATDVARALVEKFAFPDENVSVILDMMRLELQSWGLT
jgi:uncharacterized caspase-like protein